MKNQNRTIYILITVLLLLGLTVFCYRHWALDVPMQDEETVNSWMVEASLKFNAMSNTPIKASLMIPYTPVSFAILDEYFVSHHYGVNTDLKGANRQVTWSVRRAYGQQSLYFRAVLKATPTQADFPPSPPIVKQNFDETQKDIVHGMIAHARETSADIQTFSQNIIHLINKNKSEARLLWTDIKEDSGMVRPILAVLNQAKVHAMAVKALSLKAQHKVNFRWYILVYTGNGQVFLDPKTARAGLPPDVLIWQYGDEPTFEVTGASQPHLNLTISKTPMNALSIAKLRGLQTDSEMLRFSLLQLPVNVQDMYKILLTVPLGAFIILLLRNFVGLKTFGTFMPVLIALAFRETHIVWGVSLFILIVALGLLVRFCLSKLHLLLVPRLSAILTVVIMLMVCISIISQNLGLDRGLSVALFPMVILTMTIERMCIMWDERGATDALKSGFGSLLAALMAYSVMNQPTLQYLFFAFPELLFVLLAFILWFGQYRGYRLMELIRFKSFAPHKSPLPNPLPKGERGTAGDPLPFGERGTAGDPLPFGERGTE